MKYLLNYKVTLLGIAGGAVAGYAYYYFIGCAGGTCPITSQPLNSTAYGALMGALLLNTFKPEAKTTVNKQNDEQNSD